MKVSKYYLTDSEIHHFWLPTDSECLSVFLEYDQACINILVGDSGVTKHFTVNKLYNEMISGKHPGFYLGSLTTGKFQYNHAHFFESRDPA